MIMVQYGLLSYTHWSPLCRLLMFQFNPVLYVLHVFETKLVHTLVINILAYSQILYLLFRDRRACVSL